MVAMTPSVKCHLRPFLCVSADLRGRRRVKAENRCRDFGGLTSASGCVLVFWAFMESSLQCLQLQHRPEFPEYSVLLLVFEMVIAVGITDLYIDGKQSRLLMKVYSIASANDHLVTSY